MTSIRKIRMFTPGPTPLLPEALLEAVATPLNHRKDDFKVLLREVQQGLRRAFKTENDVLIMACSGSGAMEAAMTNLLSRGDKAIIGVAGKFGERWMELASRFGIQARIIEVPYGESFDPADFDKALAADSDAKAVFVQAMETSTGALMDIETLGKIVNKYDGTTLVVDAITAIGSMPVETDAWNLDVVIAGSQKAFMLPPGVAMMSVSGKAWKQIENCQQPRYYFDLLKERKAQREGQTAFTPAISLIQGLKAALALMLGEGIEGMVANAALQAGATRAALYRWGVKVFPRIPGNAVTAFTVPQGLEASKVIRIMRDRFGAHLSGGQGSMKGKILRIGHLGYFDFLETLGMIGCLELALMEAGATLESGSGSKAALDFYRSQEGHA